MSTTEPGGLAFLQELEALIRGRITQAEQDSYTSRLARAGVLKVAQKLGEEGVETALAAVAQDEARLRDEAADLIYHLLVLLALRQLTLGDVVAELARRHTERQPGSGAAR